MDIGRASNGVFRYRPLLPPAVIQFPGHKFNGEPLYQQLVDSPEMPAFDSLFASLGSTVAAGEVILQQHGPGATLRQQILQPLTL